MLDTEIFSKFLLKALCIPAGSQPEIQRCIDQQGNFLIIKHPAGIVNLVSRHKRLSLLVLEIVVVYGRLDGDTPQFRVAPCIIVHSETPYSVICSSQISRRLPADW